ncbi:unnamed protein product [Symbiodinium natans]|uniref:Reverse transcriptase domain-containing protein n=1 Tax=Symbiodinium natans TaxID=878477 RepID=A0A812R9I2_9DINO|nr:unnamed protein product [Symbiodinium natans]
MPRGRQHSLQLRVPTIRSVVSPAPSSFHASSPVQLVQILDVASQEESSIALGQWSRDLQLDAQATTGKGWWVDLPRRPFGLTPSWGRPSFPSPLDDPLLPVLKDWVHADDRSSLTRELVPQVEAKYKEALASQTSQNSESYSKWLEEAQNDHLRPLYRSLRADEQTLERPYREFTPLARPYKRLEFWCEVWQGNLVSPAPLQGEVWDALCDLAREQVRSLPKHSANSVAKICAAKNPKKGGPDGWDFNDLRDLPRDAYAILADVFNKMEEDLVIPLQVSQVQIVLLAKSALKERPIGLTSVLWRLWCKTRRFLVGQWLDSYIPDHPFDSAIPGRTSLDVALARKCSKESARVKGLHTVSLFVDMNGFYDSVSWQRLCEQGLRLSFPALALCLSLRLYQGGRTVVGESQPSPTIFPGDPDIVDVVKDLGLDSGSGRSRYGSTDTILDMTAHEVQDPYLIVVTQHVESLFRMMARCNRMGWEAVKDTWRVVWKRLEAAKHGWSVVTGPISAMCQYLRDLQVDGHDPSRWLFEERVLEITPSEVSIVCQTSSFLTGIIKTQRSRRMGSASSAAGAGGGVDWTVPRRLLKSVRTKTTRYAYRAVFQGSILHNGNGGKAIKCYRELKADLETQGLTVSTTKTAFICSNKVKGTSIRVRLFNGSIRSSALYGHEGVGVAPKRRKWFRSLLAAALGRPTLASTDSSLEFHSNTVVDPTDTIMSQHFKAVRRLLLSWPDRDIGRLHQSWDKLGQWLSEAEHPWKRAAGPLGAAWCYLQELGWEAVSLSKWRVEGKVLDILQGPDFHALLFQLKQLIDKRRHCRIAQLDGGKGLETGPDWTTPRRLLKQANKQEKAALQALWQGAVKASPTATCSLCNQPATRKHVLWECQWWKKHGEQPPRWWEDYPEHQSTDCLWNFGLMPNLPREFPHRDSILEVRGVLRNPDQIPEGAFAATDASGGPTTDHRLQNIVWGLIVYEWCGDTPKQIGSIAGLLGNEQSVYRGEAKAIQQAALLLPKGTDVTSDCKGAVARARNGGVPSMLKLMHWCPGQDPTALNPAEGTPRGDVTKARPEGKGGHPPGAKGEIPFKRPSKKDRDRLKPPTPPPADGEHPRQAAVARAYAGEQQECDASGATQQPDAQFDLPWPEVKFLNRPKTVRAAHIVSFAGGPHALEQYREAREIRDKDKNDLQRTRCADTRDSKCLFDAARIGLCEPPTRPAASRSDLQPTPMKLMYTMFTGSCQADREDGKLNQETYRHGQDPGNTLEFTSHHKENNRTDSEPPATRSTGLYQLLGTGIEPPGSGLEPGRSAATDMHHARSSGTLSNHRKRSAIAGRDDRCIFFYTAMTRDPLRWRRHEYQSAIWAGGLQSSRWASMKCGYEEPLPFDTATGKEYVGG